jgi:molybdopterin-guanine dinucleotide biosynthesis protein
MKIHSVFNATLLTPKVVKGLEDLENREIKPATSVILVNGFEEYEVEKIIDSRIKRNKLQYKIKWKNYPDPAEDTWEDESNVTNATNLVQQFYRKYPHKPRAQKHTRITNHLTNVT